MKLVRITIKELILKCESGCIIDVPIIGYGNGVVNTLRLWEAESMEGFTLNYSMHKDM